MDLDAVLAAVSRRVTAGMTIAAATTWVSISRALVAGAALTIRSGAKDRTVSTTVVRAKVLRGRRATRDRTTARTTPIRENSAVIVANPRTGIGAPSTSRLIPAVWPMAATTGVATLAAAVAAR